MYVLLLIILIIAVIGVIFGIQNTALVTLKLFGLKFESSLALVLLIFLGVGIILAFLFSIPYYIKYNKKISTLKKRIKELELKNKELEEAKKALEENAKEIVQEEE